MARVIEKGVIMRAKEERRGRELDEPGLPLSRVLRGSLKMNHKCVFNVSLQKKERHIFVTKLHSVYDRNNLFDFLRKNLVHSCGFHYQYFFISLE